MDCQRADLTDKDGKSGNEKITRGCRKINDENKEHGGWTRTHKVLIKMAINNSPYAHLTVSGICEYIRKNFPHFNSNNGMLRDSIANTLSKEECFNEVASQFLVPGAENYWTYDASKDYFDNHKLSQAYKNVLGDARQNAFATNNPHPHDISPVMPVLNYHPDPFNWAAPSVYPSATAPTAAIPSHGNAVLSPSLLSADPSIALTTSTVNKFPFDPVQAASPDNYTRESSCSYVPDPSLECQYQQIPPIFEGTSTHHSGYSISSKISEQSSSYTPSTRSNSEIAFKSPDYSMISSYAWPGQTKSNIDSVGAVGYLNPSSRTAATMPNTPSNVACQRADMSGKVGISNVEKIRCSGEETNEEDGVLSFSSNTLIKMAIKNNSHRLMTSSDITEYIAKNFPCLHENNHYFRNKVWRTLLAKKYYVKVDRDDNDPGRGYYWTYDANMDDEATVEGIVIDRLNSQLMPSPTSMGENVPLDGCRNAFVNDNSHPHHTSPVIPDLKDYRYLYHNWFNMAAPSVYHSATASTAANMAGVTAATAAMLPHGNAVHSPSLPSADPSTALTTSKFNKYPFDPAQATSADNTIRESSCSYGPDPSLQCQYQPRLPIFKDNSNASTSLGSHRSSETIFSPYDNYFPQ